MIKTSKYHIIGIIINLSGWVIEYFLARSSYSLERVIAYCFQQLQRGSNKIYIPKKHVTIRSNKIHFTENIEDNSIKHYGDPMGSISGGGAILLGLSDQKISEDVIGGYHQRNVS